MPILNPKRQKVARATLDGIFANASNVWVIHYSCESFDDRPEGRSPRITSIAVRNLGSGQTNSFSIHKVAEVRGVSLLEIGEHYDSLEREMLQDFYGHLKNYRQAQYLHWNMRDSNYGFQAIEHRFRVLGGSNEELYVVHDNDKTDLSRLLVDIYGIRYIGHPRLESLIDKNDITRLQFLSGKEEAKAFDDKDLVALHQSTLRKVDVLANIAGRANDGILKANTTWWEMHGGGVRQVYNWITEHPKWGFIGVAVAITIAIAAIVCQ